MKKIIFILSFIPYTMLAQSDSIIVTGKFSEDLLTSDWFRAWNSESVNYQPDAAIMTQLSQISKLNLNVAVYLGTWCEDSKTHVPAFIQVANKMELSFTLIGVNREKECPFDKKECKNWDITNVPTFIVFRDDKEIGRIVEMPKRSIEFDLLKILND